MIEIICACCGEEDSAHYVPCEGDCGELICECCRDDFIMLDGPIVCPDCSPSMVTEGKATIVWTEDLSEWVEDRLAKMAPGAS